MSADTPDTAETLARKIAFALEPFLGGSTHIPLMGTILPLIRDAFREREQEVAQRTAERDHVTSCLTARALAAESALAEAKGLLVEALDDLNEGLTVAGKIRAFLARPEGKPAERCAACTTGQHRSCDQRAGNVCGVERFVAAPQELPEPDGRTHYVGDRCPGGHEETPAWCVSAAKACVDADFEGTNTISHDARLIHAAFLASDEGKLIAKLRASNAATENEDAEKGRERK